MTNTEMIKDMLERQKAFDTEVFKKHNITSISREQLESALFDELGELMHAQKSDWCWWEFTQELKDEAKVFEEYIDVVHFALMYEIEFGSGCYMDEDIKMWIRSQDRLQLHNVNRIEIEHFDNKEIVTVTGDGWFLGEYSTEEEALNVLDEIQKLTEYLCSKAFQMPQDDSNEEDDF